MKPKILTVVILSTLLVSFTAANNVSSTGNFSGSDKSLDASKPMIVFFYSPTCGHCDRVEEYLQSVNSSRYELRSFKASTKSDKFSAFLDNHSVPTRYAGAVPTVFIGEESAVGSKKSIELIKSTLNSESDQVYEDSNKPVQDNADDSQQKEENTNEGSISKVGLLGLAGLAITDSVNPCALAVLLILIGSIMSGNLRNQIRALKSGASFTAGIFLSYFSMGVLLVFGIKSVQKATAVSFDSIYLFFGGFAVLIGLLNLKDWYSHGLGGFVVEVPYSWRPKMKSYLKKVAGPKGAFITAVIVSLFLLPCTSGPYFVAGGILSNTSWTTAIPLLLLYNVIFVGPMLLILGTLYYGATEVEKVQEWREQNIELLHLLAGLILIALGMFLLYDAGMFYFVVSVL